MSSQRGAAWILWGTTGIGCYALAHDAGLLGSLSSALWGSVTLVGLLNAWPRLPLELAQATSGLPRWMGIALLPLATRFDPDALENPNRKKVLSYIEANPGASIQEVRDAVGIAWGTTVYHLDRLRRQEKVVSHRQGNHHRYWRSGTPEARLRRGWAVLEQDTARDIAMAVAAHPGVHQGAICEELDVRAPSASKHLSRLERNGLVVKQRVSRYVVYQATDELERILAMRDGPSHAPTAIAPATPDAAHSWQARA